MRQQTSLVGLWTIMQVLRGPTACHAITSVWRFAVSSEKIIPTVASKMFLAFSALKLGCLGRLLVCAAYADKYFCGVTLP